MKIAAFVTSHSHNGNVATAAKELLRGAAEAGAETEIYYINDYDIKPCVGCRVCEKTDKCVIKGDDMPKLHEALIECDAYVLGTPTFYGDIPGSFKTFVDRVYPFVAIGKDPVTKTMTFGSNMPRRKPGVQICVSGNHGAKVFDSHLKVGYFCFNDLNAYPWEEILIPNTSWVAVKDNEEKLQELYDKGRRLVEHLKNNEPEDKERTKVFYDHFRLLEDVTLPCFEEK
ncbi:MAG: flavodoxin family protein [Clostridiales bacterium]|nr:flavodoxin family protein [Clostridiales bacterium]